MHRIASVVPRFARAARPCGQLTRPPRQPRSQLLTRSLCTHAERVSIVFVEDGEEISVEVEVGKTILEAAHDNDIDLEGACDGSLACSTCHVILEQNHYDALPPPDEEEEDMLDLAFGLTDTSRLGCQIKVRMRSSQLPAPMPPPPVKEVLLLLLTKDARRPGLRQSSLTQCCGSCFLGLAGCAITRRHEVGDPWVLSAVHRSVSENGWVNTGPADDDYRRR